MPTTSLLATTGAMIPIFLMGLVGFVSRRLRIVTGHGVKQIARLVVDFILPGALFHATYTQYTRDRLPSLAIIGVAQFGFFAVALTATLLAHRLVRARSHAGTAVCLTAAQNNVYLPIPVAAALLPAAENVQAQFFIGCFVLFVNPILWALGPKMLAWEAGVRVEPLALLRSVVTSPLLLAVVAGIAVKELCTMAGIGLPRPLTAFTKLCLEAMVPFATIVLGGVLAEARWSQDFDPRGLAVVIVVKLLLIPALTLGALRLTGLADPLLAFVILLQATMPPATNISLVAKRFGGNASLVAVSLFVTYLLAMLTIPFWLSLHR
ncbi:MAG: AEC family transporter [Candidatus Sumerlaeaceae bacterium]|nr:AEC family transporter [Candidatus Sumerlaeaceae bacterium]